MFKHLSPKMISVTSACVMKKLSFALGIQNFIPSHDNSIDFWYTSNKFLPNSPNGSTPATALPISRGPTDFATRLCDNVPKPMGHVDGCTAGAT